MRRQDIPRQKRHPFKEVSDIGINVTGHFITVGLEVAHRAPDQTAYRVAAVRIGSPVEIPDDVITGDRFSILPGCTFSDLHMYPGLVGIPTPLGQHPRFK